MGVKRDCLFEQCISSSYENLSERYVTSSMSHSSTQGKPPAFLLLSFCPYRAVQLNHLKRIRSSKHDQQLSKGKVLQVLLAQPDIYYALDEAKRQELEGRHELKPVVYAVPELEPRTRAQFERGQSVWPMIFHQRYLGRVYFQLYCTTVELYISVDQ